jgi:hypothetical protein
MSVITNRLQAGGAGQLVRLVKYGGLLLACAVAVLLSTGARAQASECVELEECQTAATWEKAVSDDFSNKAAWFRATSRQNFINAYEWGQKATFAFYAGDATAATWYKAIADDYSSKSVADAKAAENYGNQALFWAAAADTSFRRYIFIAESPEYEDTGTASVKGKVITWGWKKFKKANDLCKGFWKGVACTEVVTRSAEGVVRWVLDMAGIGSHCLKQKTHNTINPSTGYIERVWHECTKWS